MPNRTEPKEIKTQLITAITYCRSARIIKDDTMTARSGETNYAAIGAGVRRIQTLLKRIQKADKQRI